MKYEKKVQSKTAPIGWIVAGVALVIVGLAVFMASQKNKVVPSPAKPQGNSPHSSDTLTAFWEHEIKPIAEQWAEAKFPYPELNARSAYLSSKIREATQKNVRVHASFNYHWKIKTVSATTGLDTNENRVTVILRIPALLDSFQKLKDSGRVDWRTVFRTYVTIMLMHELEHAGHEGLFLKLPVNLDEESRAWAETCRHTIVPLVEHHGLQVNYIDEKFYTAWKECTGNTSAPTWQKLLREYYHAL